MFILPDMLRIDARSAMYAASDYGTVFDVALCKHHAERAIVAYSLLAMLHNAKPLQRRTFNDSQYVMPGRVHSGRSCSLPGGYRSLRNLVWMREFIFYNILNGFMVHVSAKTASLPCGTKVQWLIAESYK